MRHFINKFSKIKSKDVVGCEVGVEFGNHAKTMFEGIKFKELHLVDNSSVTREMAVNNLSGLGVTWHFDDSLVAAKNIPNEYFDFVYIDADHSYESVKSDIIAWFPKVKKGGFLAGHDWAMGDVKRAVNEFTEENNYKVKADDDERNLHEDWYFQK